MRVKRLAANVAGLSLVSSVACVSTQPLPKLYTVEAEVAASNLNGKGGKNLPAELAASGVILQGGKVAFYPRFACYVAQGSTGEDRCEKVLAILESQARDAGYWVVPWRALDARDVHGSAKRAGIRYLFEIDTFNLAGPLQGAWSLNKLVFREQDKGATPQAFKVGDLQPVVERCSTLFGSQLAAYQAPVVASMRARLLAIDDERVLWTYQRSLAEEVAPPPRFVRYHEITPPDQRKPFYRKLALGLVSGAAAALVTSVATVKAPRGVPISFAVAGAGLGAGAGYTYYQSRQFDAPSQERPADVLCAENYAQAENPWAKAAPTAEGEVILADSSAAQAPSVDVRQDVVGAKLLAEFIAAIGPLERKAWAPPEVSAEAGKDPAKPNNGDKGKKAEPVKWPWLAPGTDCKVIHSGPPGCPVQLICGATWVQCVTMDPPYGLSQALPVPAAAAPATTTPATTIPATTIPATTIPATTIPAAAAPAATSSVAPGGVSVESSASPSHAQDEKTKNSSESSKAAAEPSKPSTEPTKVTPPSTDAPSSKQP